MRSLLVAFSLLPFLGCSPAGAAAQLPFLNGGLEVRGFGASASGTFSEPGDGLGAGAGLGGSVGASLGVGLLAGYGEYQFVRFGCDACAEGGVDDEILDAGWEAGVELTIPLLPFLPVRPWLRGGIVGHQAQLSGADGRMTSEPGSGYGFGAGLDLRLGSRFAVSSDLRYRSYPATWEFDQLELPDRSTDVNYLLLGLGLVARF